MTANIYFISDTHFNHKGILNFGRNKFSTIEKMDTYIINNWNRVVRPEDIVIHCGDVFMRSKVTDMKILLDKLNGTKILVRGNHDETHTKMIRAGFTMSVDRLMLIISGKVVEVSHYPFKPNLKIRCINFIKYFFKEHVIKHYKKRVNDTGNFLICGHTHQLKPINSDQPRMYNVGVDANDYTPVSMNKIRSWIDRTSEGLVK